MSAFNVAYDNAIAVVTFDLPGEPVNKLTTGVMREFEDLMTQLRANAGARAVVFISGKPDSFIAGADIEEFVRLQNRTEAEALSRKGQELMTLVE
ncbi:MAG TPA: enoyl-CoA hydratase-related protein, partial [Gemmatimonadales bacterium]|nr:enoyl-CoA hydratase-related protein [Gemmatimonadales bacterium]